jgi:hypothetical protein
MRLWQCRFSSGLVALGLLIGACAPQAQSLPDGWLAWPENNGVSFSPRSRYLGPGEILELWVPPRSTLQPGVSLQDQMQSIRQQVGATQGTQCAPPETVASGQVLQDCIDDVGLRYALLQLRGGKQAQLVLIRTNNFDHHVDDIEAVLKIAMAGNGPALRTAPGKGVADSQIANIYVVQRDEVVSGGGTFTQVEHTTYLMLKDGTAYYELDFPPDELDIEGSRQLEPAQWMQWRNRGSVYEIRNKEGEWEELDGRVMEPTRNDLRLQGSYTHYNMSGSIYTGMSTSQATWSFSRDGSFTTSTYGTSGSGLLQGAAGNSYGTVSIATARGSSTTSSNSSSYPSGARVGAGSSRTGGADPARSGTYQIKGWVMEIQRDNGVTQRMLVTFYNNGDMDINSTPYFLKKD